MQPTSSSDEGADHLATGLLITVYQPLDKISQRLIEVQDTQTEQLESLRIENERFIHALPDSSFSQTFTKLPIYQQKLVNLKKEMEGLSERTQKLKQRTETQTEETNRTTNIG